MIRKLAIAISLAHCTFVCAQNRDAYQITSADGVVIAVQEWGDRSAAPIVFVHGFAQSHLSWGKQYEGALARDFHIVTYDLRGHGASGKPLDPGYYTDGARWADDLKAVLDACECKQPVLVGWSMGGRVLLDYLAKYGQDQVRGLVFVDSALIRGQQFTTEASTRLLPLMRSENLLVSINATREFLRDNFMKQPSQADFEVMLAYNMVVPVEVRRAVIGRPMQFEGLLKAIRVPTLFIHGEHDRLVPAAVVEHAATLVPGAQLSTYSDAGHAPFFENPERFNAEITVFGRGAGGRDIHR